jgi:hypothetical protein
MAIDAGTTDIKALRVGSTVISRAFLGNQKIYDQLDYPTLDLNFALTKTLDPRVTFTRASTATYFDSAGVLRSAAINEPRFDYNPATLVAQGLLIEEQRTNLLLRSADFSTTWVRFGTTSLNVNTSVAPDGTTSGDNIVFTSASAGIYQIVSGSASTTYAFSVWVKSSSSTQVKLVINTNLFDPVIQTVTVTTGWNRFSVTKTTSVGTTEVTAQIQDNGSGNTQFDIWGAQLERGAFATSVIPTTTTALTRAADVASVNTLSPWFNATTGTVFGEWNSFANSTGRYVVDIEQAASSNDRIDINVNTSNVVNPRTVVGGAAIASLAGGTYTVNTNAKVAFAYASADYASSLNGAAAVTATTAGALPSSLARMFIGSLAGATQINGYLRRITYFNRRLANSELQLLSS